MNASTFRRRISLLFAALSLTPLLASGAPVSMDFKVLIDADNRESTGCTVVTTAGLVKGIDHVLTTSVSYDSAAGTAAVTGVTRQTCTDSVSNTFSAAIPVDTTGWPVGVGAGGNLLIETHMPLTALGGVTNMHFAFAATSGTLADSVILDDDGSKIIWPPLPGARRHAAGLATTRVITLDGNDADWAGIGNIADGNSDSSPALRFLTLRMYMNDSNLFFAIAAQANANAPTANDDSYTVERGKSLGIGVPGVLANDTDPNHKSLIAKLIAGVQHGTLTLNADGSFLYQNDGSSAPNDSFQYKANNGSADSNTAHVDITVTEPNPGPPPVKPAFTSPNNTRFQVGQQKTFTITTTPLNPAVTVTKQGGTLPAGLNFNATPGSGTGQISGTPQPNTGGTYALVFRATNAVGFTDQNFTLTVCNIINVGNPATTTATAGVPFSQSFTQTGAVGTATFSTASPLPAGLTLASNGVLSGTPTQLGTFPITVTVTDSQGCSGTGTPYTLVVSCPVDTITPPSLPNATQNVAYSQQLTGNPASSAPFTFAITNGALPAGLGLSASGLISGTPTASGTFNFQVTATDHFGCTVNQQYTLNVCVTPSVTIIASATTICAGTNVTFTATPVNGGASPSYQWKVNGGNVGSNSNTFSSTTLANGDQVIVVMTSNATPCVTGNPATSNTITMTVNAIPPTPTASNGGPYCQGATVALSTPTVSGATYSWTGPNGFTSTQQNPTIPNATTAAAGTYSVTVTVNGCTSAAGTTNVVVNPTPATPTASNGGPYCQGSTISLSTPTVSGASYSWTGPNSFTSTQQNPTIANATTANAGTYSVTVTVNGCPSAAGSTNVVVNPTPATPSASNTGPYCVGATISLSTPTVSGASYAWTGPNSFTSTLQNPTIANATTANAGTYSVTITVSGCPSAAGSTNVVVNTIPATPTASNGGPYCEGATISLSTPTVSGASYSWTGPSGFTSAQQNPTIPNATVANGGSYSVTVTVNGCTSAAGSTSVVVNPTPATPTPSNGGPYCVGGTISLSTATVSGASYAWTGPNSFTSTQQNPTIPNATTANAGTYSVTVTVNGCPSAAGSTNVVVNTIPATPTANNGGPYCQGATISLSTPTVSGATYSWTGPNSFTSAQQNPTIPNATTAATGTYSVTVTVNGCTSAPGTTSVTVNPTPATPTASNGGPYCEGATISLSTPTVSGASYSWTGPNSFTSTQQNPTIPNATTANTGTYSVTITVNGCPSAAGTTGVVVNPTPATPTASNGGPYCEGATISLSTPTVSGASYAWTGPNSFTSTQQNPTILSSTTANAGTYSVTITVNGCPSAAGTTDVVVNTIPATPTASNGGPYCEGATISLSTPTVSGASYAWTGPNSFTSTQQNPTIPSATTANAGTYSVTVTVNGCTSAAGSTSVVVNPTPATPTASNGGPYCQGATISLSTPTVSGASYSWTGPNSFTSTQQNPTIANATTANAGTYSVTITVNGCPSAAGTTSVVVNPTPATPTASNTGPYCEGATISLSTPTVSGASYSWTGPNSFTSTQQNPTILNSTTANAGTYSVTITVNGCPSAAGTTNVVVNTIPATPTASNGGPYCAGATISLSTPTVSGASYSWTGPNSFTSTQQNPTIPSATTANAGTYSVTVTVNGCTSAAGSTSVVVNPTPATPTASNGGPYCAGATISLSTPTVSGASYSWTGPNSFTSTQQNPTILNSTTANGGTYSVTVTVNGCPSAAGTTNVTVNPIPATPTASNGGPYCVGSTISLSTPTVSGASYSWTGPNSFTSTQQNPTILSATSSNAGTYSVTVTVNGCTSAAGTTSVVVNANPAAPTITPTPSPVCSNSTGNTASGPGPGFTYSWQIANGVITNGQTSQTVTYTAGASGTTDLTLTVTDANGCSASNTVNVTIVASPSAPTITAPSGVCAGSTGNTASGPIGANSYSWGITNGSITAGQTSQTVTWTAGTAGTPATLSLTVTNANGCPATNSQDVVVNANPSTPTITPSATSVCPSSTGNTATGPNGANSYSWSISNGTITGGQTSQTVTYTAGATGPVGLTLTVTNAAGCSATNTASVTVVSFNIQRVGGGSFPAATFGVGYPAGNQFTANCTGCTGTIHWAFQSGGQPPGINVTITAGTLSGIPSATGQFTMIITATDTGTGCSGSASFPFTILPDVGVSTPTNATGQSYSNLVNNTQAYVTGGSTSAPTTSAPAVTAAAVQLSGTIVSGDKPSSGVTVDASSVGTFATNAGGSVTIAADGTFLYTPPLSNITSDFFNYTATSNTGTVPSIPQYAASTGAATNTGKITLNLTNRVWYVKNDGTNGNGQSQSPFNSLANFTNAARVTPDAANDYIFIYTGDGATTNQTSGIKLLSGEQLIGQGVALVVNSQTLLAAGTKPQITNSAGDGITLNNGNTVEGLTVTGTSGNGITGTNTNGLTMDTVTATAAGAASSALVLTTPSNNVTLTNTTLSNSPNCLTINGGTANFSMNNTNTITANAGQRSINFANLGATSITNVGAAITDNGTGMQVSSSVNGAAVSFTGTQTLGTTTNTAVNLSSNGATSVISFSGTLGITTSSGTGFSAGTGTLNVSGTANITTGAAPAALSLSGATVGASGVTFNSVNATGPTTGISVVNTTNATAVVVNGGTINNAGTGVTMQGSSTNLTLSNVTIGGTTTTGITNTTNFGTLTGNSLAVSAVTALNLTSGTLAGSWGNVSSSGGTNGVSLNGVSGSFSTAGGTLSGASGSTFKVVGGTSGTIGWGGAITQANGALVVDISGANNQTINFTGNVQTSATGPGTSTGISIASTGAGPTYSFSGASNTIAGSGGGVTIGSGQKGTISFGANTSITTTGTSFVINGSPSVVSAAITYDGTITHNSTGVIFNVTGLSGSMNFTNATANAIQGTFNGNGSVTSAFSNITGTVTVNNFLEQSNFNTFNGTLVAISGTNTGGSLTFSNLSLTATGSAHTAKGLTMSGGGTLTIGAGTINVSSTALDLNGIALGTSALGTLTSTGGPNGVLLTSVTGNTLTASGGALSGSTGSEFLVNGGTPSFSYGGTITNTNQYLVDVGATTGVTGGSLTFSGALGGGSTNAGLGIRVQSSSNSPTFTFSGTQTLGTTGARMSNGSGTAAVTLTNNGSATFTFSGTLSIATSGTMEGFKATNTAAGTTININGITAGVGNSTIDTADSATTCPSGNCTAALDISKAALSVTLGKVNVAGTNSHVPVGMQLDTTTGTFTVTGDNTGKANGSGGTVNVPASASSTVGLGTAFFNSVTGTVNLKGMNFSITNNTYNGVLFNNDNGGGTLNANVTGCAFSGVKSVSGIQARALLQFEGGAFSSPTVTANVQNCYFNGSSTYGFNATNSGGQYTTTVNQCGFGTDVNTATTGTNNPGTTVTNPNAIYMTIGQGTTGSADYTVTNNTFWGADGNFGAIWGVLITGAIASNSSVHLNGTVSGNIVGKSGSTGSGCANNCGGIGLLPGSQGTFTTTVQNNTVQETNSEAIAVRNSLSSSTVSAIVHIKSNSLGPADTTGSPLLQRAIEVKAGLSGGANTQFCVEISGNTLTPAFGSGGAYPGNKNWGSGGSVGIRLDDQNNSGYFKLMGYGGGGGGTDTAGAAAYVAGLNTMNSYTVSAAQNGGSGFIGGASCP